MKSIKKYFYLVAILLLVALISACGQGTNNNQTTSDSGNVDNKEVLNLRSADVVDPNSPYTIGMEEVFIKKINEGTNGEIQIKHFPAGQLGKDNEIVEGVQLGSIDFAIVGAIQGIDEMRGFFLPYIFKNEAHRDEIIYGEIGEKIMEKIEAKSKGLKVIGYVPFDTRVVTVKGKEVKTPADLNGLKIRVPENPMYIKSWTAMGANPTPIAFTELFTSLQTGIVDGQENPLDLIYNNSFYEVQDTVIETNHAHPVRYLIMNKERFESLTPEQQELIYSTWKETASYIAELSASQQDDYKKKLEEAGMTFIQPDINSFIEASQEVKDQLATEIYGEEIYQLIKAAGKKY